MGIVFTDLWQSHEVSKIHPAAPWVQTLPPVSARNTVLTVRSTLVPRDGEVYHVVYVHKMDFRWRHI